MSVNNQVPAPDEVEAHRRRRPLGVSVVSPALEGLTPAMRDAFDRVKAVSSGGYCPNYDGRYKTGRAIKLLAAAGYLEWVKWRYRWTDAGRALLAKASPQ